jgi:hypothetical protein
MCRHRSGGFKQWQKIRKEVKAQKQAEGGSKFSLLHGRQTATAMKNYGGGVYGEDLEYRGSYTQLVESMPLVDRPQKPYEPPR